MPINALEAYDDLLRHHVAPALRALGFTGSAGRYTLRSETHWMLLGFQKSAFGDATDLSFTLNLTVVGKADWKAAAPALGGGERPAANTKYGVGWERRIGPLLPTGGDCWWPVRADTDTAALGAELVSLVTQTAVPAMRAAAAG